MDEEEKIKEQDRIYGYWGVVKAFAVIAAISVISYKILITPIEFVLDFSTLLSLLLAFFSVGLSALFYFKATETSNSFYDNTHKFTRDIAQLLAKMESGFGERLKHLDEGYSSMRDYLQTNGSDVSNNSSSKEAKKKIEEEKELANRTIEERNQIINNFVEKAHLDAAEKEQFLTSLHSKEKELEETRSDISKLKNQLRREKLRKRSDNNILNDSAFKSYAAEKIVHRLGKGILIKGGIRSINNQFAGVLENLDTEFINDLESYGLIDNDKDLTKKGYMYIKEIAHDIWG